MLPIAIHPVAGLSLDIGVSFTNYTMFKTYELSIVIGQESILYSVFLVTKDAGNIVFTNLTMFFAMGAIDIAKKHNTLL